MKKYLLLLLLLGNMYDSWSLGISGNMSEKQQVNMIDNGKALVNPDMGWTMHFYSNVLANYGSKLELFPRGKYCVFTNSLVICRAGRG